MTFGMSPLRLFDQKAFTYCYVPEWQVKPGFRSSGLMAICRGKYFRTSEQINDVIHSGNWIRIFSCDFVEFRVVDAETEWGMPLGYGEYGRSPRRLCGFNYARSWLIADFGLFLFSGFVSLPVWNRFELLSFKNEVDWLSDDVDGSKFA